MREKEKDSRRNLKKKVNELINEISSGVKEIITAYREQRIQRKLAQKKLQEYRQRLQKEIHKKVSNQDRMGSSESIDINKLELGSELLYIPWSKKRGGGTNRHKTSQDKIEYFRSEYLGEIR